MRPGDDITVGDLCISPHERSVTIDGVVVPLTPGEFDIVMQMAEHPGWVFSAHQLAGDDELVDRSPDSVSVLVSRVRQKLAAAGVTEAIETVRGFGYRLCAPQADDLAPDSGVTRELHDASWQLQEAVFDVARSGSLEQKTEAVAVLDAARRALYGSLAQE